MAVNTPVSAATNDMLSYLAGRYGLAEVRVENDIQMGPDTMRLIVKHKNGGTSVARFRDDRRDPRPMLNTLEALAKSRPNVLDLRESSIEGLDDIAALIAHAKRHRTDTSELLLTPEQADIIKADPGLPMRPEGTMAQLFGHNVQVLPL